MKLILRMLLLTSLIVIAFWGLATPTSVRTLPTLANRVSLDHKIVPRVAVLSSPAKRPPQRIRGDLRAFMHQLALVESDNNPTAVNKLGMLGKYQFSPRTLRLMGFTMSRQEFLSNEQLQDSALVQYLRENGRSLRPLITRYTGQYFKGVYITKSGILASAHLAGDNGVKRFFANTSYTVADANGMTVQRYMKRFANYTMEFDND